VLVPSKTPRLLAAARAAALFALPAAALAQGGLGMADMCIAQQYAAPAASARHLPDARGHLQQALNCLEGRKEPDFRKSAGLPCSDACAFA
jgi:hypothetical protein